MEKFGRIDYLINNAAYSYITPIENMNLKQAHYSFEVNFWAYFDLIKKVIPIMKKQGEGNIINIASVTGFISMKWEYLGIYTAAKHAVVGMTKTLALKLQKTNINVQVICPAEMKTNITKNAVYFIPKTLKSHQKTNMNQIEFQPNPIKNKEFLMTLKNMNQNFDNNAPDPQIIAEEIFKNIHKKSIVIIPQKAKKHMKEITNINR